MWQYKGNDGNFFNYNHEASRIVDGVYQEYLSSDRAVDVREVKSGIPCIFSHGNLSHDHRTMELFH